ncbi:MAG: glycosyltransferase family 39 protein [Proteobacteria bacterium]|nr:glycosyltransferase family 39 protein [Pseudomonadota bacterium]
MDTPSRPLHWELGVLLVVVLGALALFAGKAFTVDDPLFLWLGRHIQTDPGDFFGFLVNWSYTPRPMYAITRNPPLTGYYVALAAAVVGWSEYALHTAFLVPAGAAALGTYGLARRLCSKPLAAALIGLLTPVFLVSSTNIMCDTMLVAFWCGSLWCWIRGFDLAERHEGDRSHHGWLLAGATLAALASLTKYFGVALIPLLLAYGFARQRRPGPWLFSLLVPLAILVGYELATASLYGTGMLRGAASYAIGPASLRASPADRLVVGLVFAGGCLIPALFFAPLLWSRQVRAGTGAIVCLLVAHVGLNGRLYTVPFLYLKDWPPAIGLQLFLMALAGASLLALAAAELRQQRTPESWLLALWVLGTFVFASAVNWTNNGRSNLPMAPALGILIMRRLDLLARSRAEPVRWQWLAAPGVVVALLVAWGDFHWANQIRDTARHLSGRYVDEGHQTYVLGHWGLQFYMEEMGARTIDYRRDRIIPGDVLVEPGFSSYKRSPEPDLVTLLQEHRHPDPIWVHTMSPKVGAGFYASNVAPLPYAFGAAEPDVYWVWEAKKDFAFPRKARRSPIEPQSGAGF